MVCVPVERFAVERLAVDGFAMGRLPVDGVAVDRLPVERFAVERFTVGGFTVGGFAVERFPVACEPLAVAVPSDMRYNGRAGRFARPSPRLSRGAKNLHEMLVSRYVYADEMTNRSRRGR
jgi:hypothetical protein